MNYIYVILLLIGTQAYGKSTNTCTFHGGSAEIALDGKFASVDIQYSHHGPTYNNCNVSKDAFGKLIDCTTGNRDLMIVITTEDGIKGGGVMSKTLNLYEDLKCKS